MPSQRCFLHTDGQYRKKPKSPHVQSLFFRESNSENDPIFGVSHLKLHSYIQKYSSLSYTMSFIHIHPR